MERGERGARTRLPLRVLLRRLLRLPPALGDLVLDLRPLVGRPALARLCVCFFVAIHK